MVWFKVNHDDNRYSTTHHCRNRNHQRWRCVASDRSYDRKRNENGIRKLWYQYQIIFWKEWISYGFGKGSGRRIATHCNDSDIQQPHDRDRNDRILLHPIIIIIIIIIITRGADPSRNGEMSKYGGAWHETRIGKRLRNIHTQFVRKVGIRPGPGRSPRQWCFYQTKGGDTIFEQQ